MEKDEIILILIEARPAGSLGAGAAGAQQAPAGYIIFVTSLTFHKGKSSKIILIFYGQADRKG